MVLPHGVKMITDVYFDPDVNSVPFLQLIKYHRAVIRSKSIVHFVQPQLAIRCKNNFLRLAREYSWISGELDEVLFIINEINCSTSYDGKPMVLYIPDTTYIRQLLASHKSAYPKYDF